MGKRYLTTTMILVFLSFPLMKSVIQWAWGRQRKAVYSCLCPVFATYGFLHPRVISDANVFPLSLSLPVLGHNHLSFQKPFSCIGWRETLYYPGRLSLLLSGVSVWNRAAGHSRTHKKKKHIFSWKPEWQLWGRKLKWQKHFLNVGQIVWFYASGEAGADLLQGPIKTC